MQIGKNLFALCGLLAVTVSATRAQSPMPTIVPVANANAAGVAQPSKPVVADEGDQATIKMLQEMKAANREILRKQEAALAALDELEKAAEQIRILSKRG